MLCTFLLWHILTLSELSDCLSSLIVVKWAQWGERTDLQLPTECGSKTGGTVGGFIELIQDKDVKLELNDNVHMDDRDILQKMLKL